MSDDHYRPNWLSKSYAAIWKAGRAIARDLSNVLRIPRSRDVVGYFVLFSVILYVAALLFIGWKIPFALEKMISQLVLEDSPSNIESYGLAFGALLTGLSLFASVPFFLLRVWYGNRDSLSREREVIDQRMTTALDQLGAERIVKVQARRVSFDR